jgi:thiosulfate reductase cytochrome b subunit
MADSAYLTGMPIPISEARDRPRHSAVVRITHWINTLSFIGLLVSGVAILPAHPRLYWGETGGVGTPSLIDLPLPFMLGGQSGWGRSQHFLFAWMCVLNGLLYLLCGIFTRHFYNNLLPQKTDLRFKIPAEENSYNVLQRLTYLVVVFVLFPLIIWTGLAMSPAIVSVFPVLVTVLGGHQSARTIHFFAAVFLVLFLLIHIVMVCVSGFRTRMRTMITGHP